MREEHFSPFRVTSYLLFYYGMGLLAALLISPPVYNGLLWLGRQYDALEFLRQLNFSKVANRCLLLAIITATPFMMRRLGMRGRADMGFAPCSVWRKHLFSGYGLGVITLLPILLLAWLSNAYGIDEREMNWGLPLKMLGTFFGALLIGYVEEWLFRGVIFGMFKRGYGIWIGAIIASIIFSSLHFARPSMAAPVVHAHWYSAFTLLPNLFTWQDFYWTYEGYKIYSLFFMGTTLSLAYVYFKNLYFCIGIHAGWVWAMRLGDYCFRGRNHEVMHLLFGPSAGVVKSGLVLLLALGCTVLIAGAVLRAGRSRAG